MLDLKIDTCEDCAAFVVTDQTGLYEVDTNEGGYGDPNTPAGPQGFDSMTLRIWKPKADLNAAPDFTVNLLASIPDPDDNYHFQWRISAASLGLEYIVSGSWYIQVEAVIGTTVYSDDVFAVASEHIQKVISDLMKKFDPTAGCKDCEDASMLMQNAMALGCGGTCDEEASQRIIDHLYWKSKTCC